MGKGIGVLVVLTERQWRQLKDVAEERNQTTEKFARYWVQIGIVNALADREREESKAP